MPEAGASTLRPVADRIARRVGLLGGQLADLLGSMTNEAWLAAGHAFLTSMHEQARAMPAADEPGTDAAAKDAAPHPLDVLVAGLGLSPVEIDLLLLAGMAEEHEGYGSLLRALHPRQEPRATVGLAAQLFCGTVRERQMLREILQLGPAVSSGALSLTGDAPLFELSLVCADALWPVLNGLDVWPVGVTPLREPSSPIGLDQWLASSEVERACAAVRSGHPRLLVVTADSAVTAQHRAMVLVARAGFYPIAFAWPPAHAGEAERLLSLHALSRGAVPVLRLTAGDAPPPPEIPSLRWLPTPFVVCMRHGDAVVGCERPLLTLAVDPLSPTERRRVWAEALPQSRPPRPRPWRRATPWSRTPRRESPTTSAASPCCRTARCARRTSPRACARVRTWLCRRASSWCVPRRGGINSSSLPITRRNSARRWGGCRIRPRVLDEWGFLKGRAGRARRAHAVRRPAGHRQDAGRGGHRRTSSASTCSSSTCPGSCRSGSARRRRTSPRCSTPPSARRRCCCSTRPTRCSAGAPRSRDAHDRYANLETAYLLPAARALRRPRRSSPPTCARTSTPAFIRRLEFVVDFHEPSRPERERLWQLPSAQGGARPRHRRQAAGARSIPSSAAGSATPPSRPAFSPPPRSPWCRTITSRAPSDANTPRPGAPSRACPRAAHLREPRRTAMADPTTLLEYAQRQLDRAKAEKANAQTRLEAVDGRATWARNSLASASAKLQELKKREADVRKQLPDVPTKVDGDALLNQLELTIIGERAAQAGALEAAAALAVIEARRSRAAAALAEAQQALSKAQAGLQSAKERSDRLAVLAKALAEPDLAGIRVNAAQAKTADPFTAAETRIKGDFPAALLTHAHNRRAKVGAEQVDAGTSAGLADGKAGDALAAVGGTDANLHRLWLGLQRADDGLSQYIATAKERFDRALALLKRIVAAAPLSDDESKEIARLATAAAKLAGEAKVLDLGGAPGSSVDDLAKNLDQNRLAAMAKGIDPDGLIAAQDAARQAQSALDTTNEAVTAAQKDLTNAVSASADPDNDPAVAKARLTLALKTKERDDAQTALDDQKKVVDDLKVAAGGSAEIDAVLASYDALKGAEATLAGLQRTWDESEDAWHAAEATRDEARRALDDAIQAAKKAGAEPGDDPQVKKAKTALDDAETKLDAAESAYEASDKGLVHLWEAAIPDTAWQLFADFEEASELLDGLQADPADLKSDQTKAEGALLLALGDADAKNRAAALLQAEAQARGALSEALLRDRSARLLTALRGD